MNERDEDLLASARAGDERAFAALYRRHREWAASLAFRYCGDRHESLDVMQEAFTYVWRRLPGLELTCRFRTFLWPVVKHIALNKARSHRREIPDPGSRTPETAGDSIEHLLTGLSEAQKEIVCMRFVDGLELAEIAEALEIPLGTVKSRLHAAIGALRGRMAPTVTK